jgi:hypothetical protein
MRKLSMTIAALAALALPAAADAHYRAPAAGVGKAISACSAERQADSTAFHGKYANKRGHRAFRRCVRRHVVQAHKTCRAERKTDVAAFRAKYGNQRHRHAFRRCVRTHAGDAVA